MPAFPRYAIYHVPARDSALWRFGAETLGYDAFNAAEVPFPRDLTAGFADWPEITADPRLYGFHATLKAPFALIDGADEAALIEACAAFCAQPRDIPEIAPVVATISGFTAIVPKDGPPALMALARDVVAAFDPFRAPLSAADRARRNPGKLTQRQVAYLDSWGYPYVMDEFRFHMTLTGGLTPERQPGVIAALQARFAALGLTTLRIDRLAIFRQQARGERFTVIEDFALAGA